jgi:hypothetical protein
MGLDLVTLSEYKTYAGISSTNQDDAIKSLIPKVSQLIKGICRRTFIDWVADTKIEVVSGGQGYKLYMKEYPLLAVSGIEYSADYGATYTDLVEFTDFVVDLEENTIVNILVGDWPKAINGYRISYTAGFEVLPVDLKLAVFDTITYYLRHDVAVHSTRNIGSNTVQIEYITNVALPAHITRILDLYKASYD